MAGTPFMYMHLGKNQHIPVAYLWAEKFAVKRYFSRQSGLIFSLFGYA